MKRPRINRDSYFHLLGPEDHLQAQVIRYVSMQYPGAILMHTPNEAARTKFERYRMKVLGLSAGFPDLLLFYRGKIIAIELKAGKNKLTPKQEAWLRILNEYFPATCCTGFDEAKAFVDFQFGSLFEGNRA